MKVTYHSNNSGGDWWLSDNDWKKLQANGWAVEWIATSQYHQQHGYGKRFLGALATKASKEFANLDDAINEWEELLGMDANEEGCPCCGQPHGFYESHEEEVSND